jgi:hypothetical protein
MENEDLQEKVKKLGGKEIIHTFTASGQLPFPRIKSNF